MHVLAVAATNKHEPLLQCAPPAMAVLRVPGVVARWLALVLLLSSHAVCRDLPLLRADSMGYFSGGDELRNTIESEDWGQRTSDYLKQLNPKYLPAEIMSDDLERLNEDRMPIVMDQDDPLLQGYPEITDVATNFPRYNLHQPVDLQPPVVLPAALEPAAWTGDVTRESGAEYLPAPSAYISGFDLPSTNSLPSRTDFNRETIKRALFKSQAQAKNNFILDPETSDMRASSPSHNEVKKRLHIHDPSLLRENAIKANSEMTNESPKYNSRLPGTTDSGADTISSVASDIHHDDDSFDITGSGVDHHSKIRLVLPSRTSAYMAPAALVARSGREALHSHDGSGDKRDPYLRGSQRSSHYAPWFTVILVATGSVLLVLASIYTVQRYSIDTSKVLNHRWIPHGVIKMYTSSSDVQPMCSSNDRNNTEDEQTMQNRGLPQQPGSTACMSMQIPASDNGEPTPMKSPVKESMTAEYLTSAGNRLSLRQLQTSVQQMATLQNEFLFIPANLPARDRLTAECDHDKNRYKNVLPNEKTRVTLAGDSKDPSSTYINANWIRGYDGEERAYIATQGPLAHTIADFWQMVLSRRARAVVMITKLREAGRIKCAGYLPETRQKATFGSVEVTVRRIFPKNGYMVRQVSVKQGNESLELQHFWYTSWPDQHSPDSTAPIIQMIHEVEAARRSDEGFATGPVVVHCSAGIGRTGCYIAISTGMCQLVEEKSVDVLAIVCAMRQDRGGMVQTADQYIFIHRALNDFLEMSNTDDITRHK